nr:hypothetical protein [Tanacetum cinerariifolium]
MSKFYSIKQYNRQYTCDRANFILHSTAFKSAFATTAEYLKRSKSLPQMLIPGLHVRTHLLYPVPIKVITAATRREPVQVIIVASHKPPNRRQPLQIVPRGAISLGELHWSL